METKQAIIALKRARQREIKCSLLINKTVLAEDKQKKYFIVFHGPVFLRELNIIFKGINPMTSSKAIRAFY